MKESLQMHFNTAVRNFHGPNASRWFLHRCSEGYQCVVVVRWTSKLPLRLPFVISIYVPLTITISLAGATRLTTLWLKHPIGLCSVAICLPYILRSAPGRFLSKRKAFLVPSCGMWTLEYFVTKKITQIVLPRIMDSSSFARHHTWQAGLSQMAAKTDMTVFLASFVQTDCNITILLLSINYLLAVHTGLPQPNTIPLHSAVVPTSLSEITPYSSPVVLTSLPD